jgi:hypothetical protein
MPWSPRQCRYFETATAARKGVPAKMRQECHEQYRGKPGGFAKGDGPAVKALKRRK